MSDHVGKVFGSYILKQLIGHGGYADVYLGEHTQTGWKRAIKLLKTNLSQHDRDKFIEEAKTVQTYSAADKPFILKTDRTQRGIKVAWSYDGNYLAAGPWLGGVAVWRLDDIKAQKTQHPYLYLPPGGTHLDVTTLAWSPVDYRIATGTSDGKVYIWQGVKEL